MTIPKRDKRRRRSEKSSALQTEAGVQNPRPVLQVEEKSFTAPPIDRMIRHYPRQCPYCGQGSFSTICKCGRLTRIVTK